MKSLPSTKNYDIPWWRTGLGQREIELLTQAIHSEHISQGPKTLELEQTIARALDIPYVTTVTSGSVALFLALLATGIGQGDEVILPSYTFIATAHAIQLTGATPVFVDTQSDIPLIDCQSIRQKISQATRAIIPVHLNGRAVNMHDIHSIAQEFDLITIEDAAQAIFSKKGDVYLGTQSDIGCFSMGMAKLVASGQGGILVTHQAELDQRLKKLRSHGHIEIGSQCRSGLNFKYTDILATIALVQLERVPERVAHLKTIYNLYDEALKDNPFMRIIPVDIDGNEMPIYAEFKCETRDELIAYLAQKKIQARPFHISLNQESHLATEQIFPNALLWEQQGVILPCGPEQPLENVEIVIEALKGYIPANT